MRSCWSDFRDLARLAWVVAEPLDTSVCGAGWYWDSNEANLKNKVCQARSRLRTSLVFPSPLGSVGPEQTQAFTLLFQLHVLGAGQLPPVNSAPLCH